MATNETKICNQSLGKIGAKRINDYSDVTETKLEAIQCRLHYEPTRDALLRSYLWVFAFDRAKLSQDITDPDFEYDSQFILPTDFLRLRSVYDDVNTKPVNQIFNYSIEGQRLLTNEETVYLKYVKKITDPTEFDPLFIETLVLHLALKLISALSGGNPALMEALQAELKLIMPKVRALNRLESNTNGRTNRSSWINARWQGTSSIRQDEV